MPGNIWLHTTLEGPWPHYVLFGDVLGRPLNLGRTFIWALRISWSRLLAHVWSGPQSPWPSHFKHSHWCKRWSRSKFASHHAWGTNGVCEWKRDEKSTWIPTWHQVGHVSWSLGLIFQNHVLEVGLTQSHKTMALRTLTIVDLLSFITCEDPHE